MMIDIIPYVVSIATALSALIWFVLNWKKNKRKEEATTQKMEEAVKQMKVDTETSSANILKSTNDEWKKLYDCQNDRIEKQDEKIKVIQKEYKDELKLIKQENAEEIRRIIDHNADELKVINTQLGQFKNVNNRLYRIVNKAYKCPLAQKATDCIVINEVELLSKTEQE